ncbi:hypothetical protein Taro_040565 [Colocasia esculenta]|uniref:30S ribosomal protein 3, chloroplastic n=1 Tax=Colocasia esculenta TaxID=4460 RepID=A0A843WDJ0_COLES|nr:hypothetical protein [Colocasia esculenta]
MMCASLAGASRATSPAVQCHLPSRSGRHHHSCATISSPHAFSVSRCSPLTSGLFKLRAAHLPRTMTTAATAAEATETPLEMPEVPDKDKEKLGVVVRVAEGKPRLVLKFIWMEKNIGLALDQVIPGHGTIPLSPYYFWPRKDAWEELKALLESKPWISQKRMIILLNQATDIINLWQQSGAGSLQ